MFADETLLYLDYDGLLHHENVRIGRGGELDAPPGYCLFQHVDLLEELLAPYPQVQIASGGQLLAGEPTLPRGGHDRMGCGPTSVPSAATARTNRARPAAALTQGVAGR